MSRPSADGWSSMKTALLPACSAKRGPNSIPALKPPAPPKRCAVAGRTDRGSSCRPATGSLRQVRGTLRSDRRPARGRAVRIPKLSRRASPAPSARRCVQRRAGGCGSVSGASTRDSISAARRSSRPCRRASASSSRSQRSPPGAEPASGPVSPASLCDAAGTDTPSGAPTTAPPAPASSPATESATCTSAGRPRSNYRSCKFFDGSLCFAAQQSSE